MAATIDGRQRAGGQDDAPCHPGREPRRGVDWRRGTSATAFAHTRRQMLPEQRRRLRHLDLRDRRHHRAEIRHLPAARLARLEMRDGAFGADPLRDVDQLFFVQMTHGYVLRDALGCSLAQELLQILQRMEHVRLGRADRAADRVRNLLVRHVVIHAQNQRRTLFVGQLRHRRANAHRRARGAGPARRATRCACPRAARSRSARSGAS